MAGELDPRKYGQHLNVEVHKTGILEISPRVERPEKVKTAVFMDAGNLWGNLNALVPPDRKFRLSKFINWISNNGADTMSVSYYVYNQEIPEELLKYLNSIGARTFVVPGKVIDGKKKEGPVDTTIGADMVNEMSKYEEAVLVSGDGDFGRPVEILMENGKRVRVISRIGHVGTELISLGVDLVLLENLLPDITAKRRKRRNKKKAEIVQLPQPQTQLKVV